MISIIIGLFAIAEVLKGIGEKRIATVIGARGSVYPSKNDVKKCAAPTIRGGLVGFFLGLLPGCSAAITSFLAYDLEKKVSKHPEQFGKGAIEGVAAPEAANNATSSAGFIPLFSLGIPSSPPLAILLAGFMIYGLTPGPVLFEQHPLFVWTVIASMFVGNAMLLVLNLPLVWVWVKLTKVPYGIMAPVILMLCTIGAYSVRNSLFDVAGPLRSAGWATCFIPTAGRSCRWCCALFSDRCWRSRLSRRWSCRPAMWQSCWSAPSRWSSCWRQLL